MNPVRRFPTSGLVCVTAVVVCGALALIEGYRSLLLQPPAPGWLVLAAMTWVSATFAIKIPSVSASISVSEVFVFALVILFGGPAATIAVAVDGLFSSVYRGNRQPRRLLFNTAEPALSLWVASYVYHAAGGPPPLSIAAAPLEVLVGPVLLLAITYLLMNTWLTAAAMALESGSSAMTIWRSHIGWLSVNFLGGASIALLLAVNMREVSVAGLVLVLPLVFILYLVFRNWTDRIRDAETHVTAVNRLYLSTVEAFAIAIESKDQVTHGHVRRVQTLSLAIADYLGVTDTLQRRAIEAGALLHDIGKVAIPDHILNKPGKLTSAEYDLMKLHAPIGSEILVAVDFPYPVVPIVRHHHENWDGTGYPDRIVGDAIPLGARILSVVDCLDALMSDRPYRLALSDEAALDIVRSRSGSMYDPAVVDALLATYRTARSNLQPSAVPAVSVMIKRANQRPVEPPALVFGASANPHEGTTAAGVALDRLWLLLRTAPPASGDNADVAFSLTATWLRAMTPATTVCVGIIDSTNQVAEIVHASGHGEHLLRHRSVPLGEGITGWVAANRSTIINSDPALDFGASFSGLSPRFTATLAVPIGSHGVLTLYTDRASGFSAADRAAAEEAVKRLNNWLTGPGQEPSSLETLSPGASVEALLQASTTGRSLGILSVALPDDSADQEQDETSLAAVVLPALRLSDSLFVTSRNEIVAVLTGCAPEAEALIDSRLQAVLDEGWNRLTQVAVGFAVTPRDGLTVASALRTARERHRLLSRRQADPLPVETLAVAGRQWV